jgi:hypothetical protein
MRETLHILRKDVRRHWAEILVGLLLLGLYIHLTLQEPARPQAGLSFPLFRLSLRLIQPLTIFFWIFLTVRVVHGETLVGDRQWWITKPYEWWTLLVAKELFLLLFLNVPLFGVQLYLLHHAGFPVLRNLGGVLNMQFGLALVLILPSVALASLTRGFGQFVLGVVALFAAVWAGVAITDKVPSNGMSSAAEGTESLLTVLVLGSFFGAVGWQYARRKTWATRGLLAGGIISVFLVAALTPYAKFVERKYPMAAGNDWPVQVALVPHTAPDEKKKSEERLSLPDAHLRLPVAISGIPADHLIRVDGLRLQLNSPDGAKWDPGWDSQWTEFWAPSEQKYLFFSMKGKDYEKLKSQTLRLYVELALTEYQETQRREIVLEGGKFSDKDLGTCNLNDKVASQVDCHKPFHQPGLMASFQPSQAKCESPEDDNWALQDEVSHVWNASQSDDSFDPGLNPVVAYSLRFLLKPAFFFKEGKSGVRSRAAHLCVGAKLLLGKPEEKRHVRVTIESDQLRLPDLLRPDDFDFEIE